jgi:cytochrome c biogenesis factor
MVRRHFGKHHLGMIIAHFGLSITAIAIVLTSTLSHEQQRLMHVGEKTQLQNNFIIFKATQAIQGPNYHGIQGIF